MNDRIRSLRRGSRQPAGLPALLLIATSALFLGCTAWSELQALRHVDFELDRVSGVRIAGIALDRVDSWSDLSVGDAATLLEAAADRQVPLEMVIHVLARNPAENRVNARLVNMDWTLFIEDRETVDGTFRGNTLLPPGQTVDVPVGVSLELVRFFGTNARDLLGLALALRGQGTKEVRLDAVPSIETPLGPVRYPAPITIRRRVGQEN